MADEKTFMVEGARIVYRNFSGKETPFKPAGTKTFAVVLDKPHADILLADGWNVKCKPSGIGSDESDEDIAEEFCFVEVTVGYKVRPPQVIVITESGRTPLTEDTVGMLDWAEIKNVDLIANAYHWSMPSGKSGIKAYLKTMFVTIEEDPLERKYGMIEG